MSIARERKRVRRPLVAAAIVAGTLVRYGVHRMLPGVAAAAAISVAAGEIAGHLIGRGLTPWIAMLTGGAFVLWFGAELNR